MRCLKMYVEEFNEKFPLLISNKGNIFSLSFIFGILLVFYGTELIEVIKFVEIYLKTAFSVNQYMALKNITRIRC